MSDNQPPIEKNKGGRPRLQLIQYEKYAKTIKVQLPTGERLDVPVDDIAVKSQCQILAVKVRDFFEKQLIKLESATLTAKEIQDVVTAAARVDSLMRAQMASQLEVVPNVPPSSVIGRQVAHMVGEVAKGAAEGSATGFLAKLKAMEDAAKPKPVEIVDVDTGNTSKP